MHAANVLAPMLICWSSLAMANDAASKIASECASTSSGNPQGLALCISTRLPESEINNCLKGKCFGADSNVTGSWRAAFGRVGKDVKCGGAEERPPIDGSVSFGRNKSWKLCSGYELFFQDDGNLVVYNPQRKPTWASGTAGHGGIQLSMQSDGNLVIYGSRQNPIWTSKTSGNQGASLIIQEDGNVIMYTADYKKLWSTNTGGS